MSVSPSYSHGAPSLAEVLITRTFEKPTNPFVDGEFIDALEQADDKPAATVEVTKAGQYAATAPELSSQDGTAATPEPPAKQIDLRA
jgi:hypothetical protein